MGEARATVGMAMPGTSNPSRWRRRIGTALIAGKFDPQDSDIAGAPELIFGCNVYPLRMTC
jgi:hypothetical protein